jgi:tripartite-type tricarboxylate transporter receptor subunit TctC
MPLLRMTTDMLAAAAIWFAFLATADAQTYPARPITLVMKATHVPYRGGAQALTDLLRGEVQFMFYQVLPVLPHIAEGKLRALAIASGKRSAALPEVPTMGEAGIGDFDVSAWFGVYAPPKTPPGIIARLGTTIVQIANAPEVQKTLVAQGIDPVSGRAEDLLALTNSDVARWAKVVEVAGARLP